MRLFITILTMVACEHPHSANAVDEPLLRSDSNSGANVVALLGGIYGVDIPPGQAGGTESVNSLKDVQSQLAAYGLNSSARFLSYDAIASRNLPCVVTLRFANHGDSSFYIFVRATEAEVYLVEAGPLTVWPMSVDDFRRYWTGYGVFCDDGVAHSRNILAWALFGFGLPLSGYGVFLCSQSVSRLQRLPARDT